MLINIKISANIVDLLFSDEVLGYRGGGDGPTFVPTKLRQCPLVSIKSLVVF
jgi:hypothetical protein